MRIPVSLCASSATPNRKGKKSNDEGGSIFVKASAMERAYDYLYESILSGKLPLGSPIYEVEVANTLGISRSPIREALKRLEAEGLVNYFSGRGAFVIQITKNDLEEIFDMRLLLECAALKSSSKCIGNTFWTEMEKTISNLSEDSPPEDFYAVDNKLHHTIIGSCSNKRLETFYHRLEMQIDIVRRISALDPMHFRKSKEYHLQIVRAMKEYNLEEATHYLEEHIMDVKRNTINAYTYGMSKM